MTDETTATDDDTKTDMPPIPDGLKRTDAGPGEDDQPDATAKPGDDPGDDQGDQSSDAGKDDDAGDDMTLGTAHATDDDGAHPFVEFENIANILDVSLSELAQQIGYSASTASKWASKGNVPQVAIFAARYVRSLRSSANRPARVEVALNNGKPVIRPRGPGVKIDPVYQDEYGAIVEISRTV